MTNAAKIESASEVVVPTDAEIYAGLPPRVKRVVDLLAAVQVREAQRGDDEPEERAP